MTTRDPTTPLLLLALTLALPATFLLGNAGMLVLTGLLAVGGSALILRSRGAGILSAPIGVIAAVALAVVMPGVFVSLTPSPSSHLWTIPFAVCMASGLRLAWIIGEGTQRLVESVVWIFIYVFLGLAPTVQMRSGTDPDTTPFIDHSLDPTALTIVVVGIVAFSLGLLSARRMRPTERIDTTSTVKPARVTALAAAGLLFAAYFVAKVGLSALFSSRINLDQAAASAWSDSTTVAIMRSFAMMPLLVAFVALRLLREQSRSAGWFTKWLLPLMIGAALLLVANPISNARYLTGTVYLAVLASLGLVATRPRFRVLCAGFVTALVLLFPLADAYRYTTSASFKEHNPVAALTTGDFDAYAQIVNTVQYVRVHGLTYGFQALGPLVFWIPRSVWPGKPTDTGILLANSRGYQFTNLSAPLWAELFINGGWLLVVFGMFVFGRLTRRWDSSIVRTLKTSRTPGLLSCILPFYLLILLRGSFLQATAALAVVALSGWFVRDRRPPRAHPGTDGSADRATQRPWTAQPLRQ